MPIGEHEPPKVDPATENGRFNQPPICQSLTGECARKFKKLLLLKGGDKVSEHVEATDGNEATNGKDDHRLIGY